ncbi:UNKNOWN [Stylonychia lemnae]|uniref:Uncharacterized protein n=1 Tax=Stylonychia lemnae TaxID=5949 RepID=A0A078AHK5_STYLE|nr:UNKNOWN [Stylonychia lemnae]|eukprot:CDW81351.1 UNKNOWN [Stylonychia lemnae]
MGREMHDLKFSNKDPHLYEGNEQNAFANVIKGFLGQNLTIQYAAINDSKKIEYLVNNQRLQKLKLKFSNIGKCQFNNLMKALKNQPNFMSFKLKEVALNDKNKDLLTPLENCKKLQIISINNTGKGSFSLIENFISKLGKQLRSFTYISSSSDSQKRFSLIKYLNPTTLKKLRIQCAEYVKYPDKIIESKDNLNDIQALFAFNCLLKLKIHLDYISFDSINALGQLLDNLSKSLRYLEIGIDKECLDLQMVFMITFSSITSNEYARYMKRNSNKEDIKQYLVKFAEGLGLCSRLIDAKLPSELLNTPLFDLYYGFMDRNGIESNLVLMSNFQDSQQCKPEIYKSFLL